MRNKIQLSLTLTNRVWTCFFVNNIPALIIDFQVFILQKSKWIFWHLIQYQLSNFYIMHIAQYNVDWNSKALRKLEYLINPILSINCQTSNPINCVRQWAVKRLPRGYTLKSVVHKWCGGWGVIANWIFLYRSYGGFKHNNVNMPI